MIIFDYFFYRVYISCEHHKMQDKIFRAAFVASIYFFCLTAYCIHEIINLLFAGSYMYMIGVTTLFIMYVRYKRKHEYIINKFRNNKIDKFLPFAVMAFGGTVLNIPGLYLSIKLHDFIEYYHIANYINIFQYF